MITILLHTWGVHGIDRGDSQTSFDGPQRSHGKFGNIGQQNCQDLTRCRSSFSEAGCKSLARYSRFVVREFSVGESTDLMKMMKTN